MSGIRSAQHSPAFLDLVQITGTDVEQASIFYTAMSVGALVGTFFTGFLFDKLSDHRHYLLAATCILGAVTTAAVPWSTNYLLTIFIFFINASFHAGFDTGANASIMSTWGVDAKMYMQFLHFSFAVGTIISPFTVQPFLSHLRSENSTTCHQPNRLNPNSFETQNLQNVNVTSIPGNISAASSDCFLSESRIYYAYLISGALCLFSGIIIAIEGCVSRAKSGERIKPHEDHRNPLVLPTWLSVLVLALTSAMFFFHCASGITIVGYLMAFSVEGLGWSKDNGTLLTSVFWVGLAVSRLLGMFVIKCLSPSKMMFLSNTIVVLSMGGLWLSVMQNSDGGVWASILFSAVGFAAIIPTGLIYLENEAMKVTGRVTSVIWTASNLQGFVSPPLLGYMMQEFSFKWYIYLALIEGALCLVFFGLLVLVVKRFVSKSDTRDVTLEIAENNEEANFIEKDIQIVKDTKC